MNGNTSSGTSWVVYGLLAALLAVTAAGALLLVPQESWDARFFLSTGVLLFAELQLVVVAALLRNRSTSTTVPWTAAQVLISGLYLLAAIGLALYGLSDISLKQLGVLHLAAFFALLLGLGATSMAAGHTQSAKTAQVQRQSWFPEWRDRFDRVCDRVGLLSPAELEPLKKTMAGVQDDLRYADRDSLPGTGSIEGELDTGLDEIAARVAALETAVGATDGGKVAAISAEVQTRLQQIRTVLRRRNEKLRSLR